MQTILFPAHQKSVSENENGKTYIFTYGSLLNKESATRTISEKGFSSQKKARAYGVKRVFDHRIPSLYSGTKDEKRRACASLNLRITNNTEDFVNGLVFALEKEDLQALMRREIGYDLVPLFVSDLEGQKAPFLVYAFIASAEKREGIFFTSTELLPKKEYAKICEEGAFRLGPDFHREWLETTYLADGKTLYKDYDERIKPLRLPNITQRHFFTAQDLSLENGGLQCPLSLLEGTIRCMSVP